MADSIHVSVKAAELSRFAVKIEAWAIQAMRQVGPILQRRVQLLTPRLSGGLAASVQIREKQNGRIQEAYMPKNVVGMVHEYNGRWTKLPPFKAIAQWAIRKLGIGGADLPRVTAMIRWKILRRGLTLPNVEGKGKMFQRTVDHFKRTGEHYIAFKSALMQNLGRR